MHKHYYYYGSDTLSLSCNVVIIYEVTYVSDVTILQVANFVH